ncbi:MAG: TIGR01777 family protein [Ignavibacteria bacterium RBG_13_36_8]|nr:MAG: TIGR01777 family protein [Ignavibacteria bacterium RBG_13_36_8]
MPKRIVITGATGMIGTRVTKELIDRGDEVIIFSRSPQRAKNVIKGAKEYVLWTQNAKREMIWEDSLEGVDAVIHLSGENVMSKRWNDEHKQNILNSRIDTTKALVDALAEVKKKPEVFICASAIGYYGSSEEKEFDEYSEAGNDFLAGVVKQWEEEARRVGEYSIRYIGIRTGIVLDKNEGALARMLTPFKFLIGGPLGNGKQWFPWIHINDVVGIYLHALDNPKVNGVLNAAAPEFITMKKFCETLGSIMHRPSFFRVPAFVLRILFGEGADILVKGAKVFPKKTIDSGYEFEYESIEPALRNLLKNI